MAEVVGLFILVLCAVSLFVIFLCLLVMVVPCAYESARDFRKELKARRTP